MFEPVKRSECFPIDETHGVTHFNAGPRWGFKHPQAMSISLNQWGWTSGWDSICVVEDARIMDSLDCAIEKLKAEKYPDVSMGCKVASPPPCLQCEDE